MDQTSSGSVLFGGALGAVAMMHRGAEEVAADHIEDPADHVAAQIAAIYGPGLGATVSSTPAFNDAIKVGWKQRCYLEGVDR